MFVFIASLIFSSIVIRDKASEICMKILFHLRDVSPIFHLYRTSFLLILSVVFNFDFFILFDSTFFAFWLRNETSWEFFTAARQKHVIVWLAIRKLRVSAYN